jgi:hypothetical protein
MAKSFDEMFPDTSKQASFDEMFPEQPPRSATAKPSPFDLQNKPKESKPLQGHVYHNVPEFEAAKQIPVVGPVIAGAQNIANNAGQAYREAQRNPMQQTIPAAVGSAVGGAVGAVEAPLALAGNALMNFIGAPQARRTFPQQQDPQMQQISRVMQQSAPPQTVSYNRAVGGTPYSDRIAQYEAQAHPELPGIRNTAALAGGLAVPMQGIGPAEQLAARALQEGARNPIVAKAIGHIIQAAAQHPNIANLARGAAEGAGVNAVYEAGGHAARGEAPTVSASGTLGGALAGAGLRTVGGALGRMKGTSKETKPTAKQPQVQEKVVGQVIKPQPQFKSFSEAYEALQKNPDNQAAYDYIKATQGGKTYEKPQLQPERATLGGQVEENIPKEETQAKPPVTTRAKAPGETRVETGAQEVNPAVEDFYQKWGKEPLPKQPEAPEENEYISRQRIPIDQVDEGGRKTKEDTGKPFDVANPEIRPAWVTRNGIRKKHIVEPVPDESGNVTHVIAHRIVGGKSQSEVASAIDSVKRGTAIGSRLAAKEAFTPEQQHANERALEENAAPQPQADAAKIAADRQTQIQRAIEVINNDNLEEAEKFVGKQPEAKKLSNVKKPPTTLQSDPLMIGPIVQFAKDAKVSLPEAAKQLLDNDWVHTIKPLVDVRDTLDRIKDGAVRNESDFYNKLMANHMQQALDSQGENVTEGKLGLEARHAIRYNSIDDILNPETTPDWTPEQRTMAAKMKHYQDEQKLMVNDEIKQHADDKEYANALKEYSGQIFNFRNDIDDAMAKINHKLYESILLRNPAYHALVSMHPLQAGATTAGPGNVAQAYWLAATDPKVKAWLNESARNLTGDYRSGFREEMYAKEGKEAPTDIPSSRWNNDRILLAGMIKASGVEGVHNLIDNFNEGKTPTEADGETILGGLEALRDATGNIIGGGNRPFTTRHPIYRILAQLSGYRGTIDRLMVNSAKMAFDKDPEVKAQGQRRLATLLAATAMLGGSAPVPSEVRDALWKVNPRAMYALEYMLDQLNVAKRIPIVGRDLSEHMRFSFLNWGKNLGMEGMERWRQALDKQWKETEEMPPATRAAMLAGRALWELPWSAWGFGGSTIKKNIGNLKAGLSKEHEKPVYAFDEGHLLGSGTRKNYGIFDALADNLPGDTPNVANWKKKQYITNMFNRDNLTLPKNLEKDYPSPGIE